MSVLKYGAFQSHRGVYGCGLVAPASPSNEAFQFI